MAGIQALIDAGRIIEPLTAFYKDEVREIGHELGIAAKFLARHPFPGPGLAIRCLCAAAAAPVQPIKEGTLLPLRSVGVQGDARSYRGVLVLDDVPSASIIRTTAPALTNTRSDINRVVAVCGAKAPLDELQVFKASINRARLDLLREADAIVRSHCLGCGFEELVWQFPVVLLPLGIGTARDSVVLRPIQSVDGMTADVVLMSGEMLAQLSGQLLALPGIAAVFYDCTHKPPGTIEWE